VLKNGIPHVGLKERICEEEEAVVLAFKLLRRIDFTN
jgi:hypothetical protein